MNKKILIISILAVFTLVAISFATAVSSNTTTSVETEESPLYGIRIRRAIGERLGEIIDFIKTRFLGDRIFFLPFQWLKNPDYLSIRERIRQKGLTLYETNCKDLSYCKITCPPTICMVSSCPCNL